MNFSDPMGLDKGWGSRQADRIEGSVEYARQFYQADVKYWGWNGTVNTVADLASGFGDMFRVGEGTACAFDADDGYLAAAYVLMDVTRAAGLFATMAGPVAGRVGSAKPSVVADPPETLPYTNSRPSYARGQVQRVWDDAADAEGRVFDPHTGEELFWNQTTKRSGQWDMGHRDIKYQRYHSDYMQGKISKEEFLRIHRDPGNYQPQSVRGNRSRRFCFGSDENGIS